MSISTGSRWFVVALLAAGMTVAALFVYVRWNATSIDGFYTVTSSFVDQSTEELTSAQFVRVETYDTTKILRVGVELAGTITADSSFDSRRARRLLMHFYVASDTMALTDVEVDELAYTNPELLRPSDRLVSVRNGYVMSSTYSAGSTMPTQAAKLEQATFYMPKPGVAATDFR